MTVALSVVIVVYDMAREAPRTITSFSRPYQQGVDEQYEIVVVDNGSPEPFDAGGWGWIDPTVQLHRIAPPASVSPARAVNVGVELASGDLVCVVVDGARLASPGLVRHSLLASKLQVEPFVVTLAWHLGPDEQPRSVGSGYDAAAEDELLDSIAWPADGYRLFEISSPAPASRRGYAMPLPESSAVILSKQFFRRLGGFDERFDQPGGGLVASDFFRRAVLALAEDPIVLVGEGTFHQLHAPPGRTPYAELLAAYVAITGTDFAPPSYRPVLFGQPRPAALPFLGRSAVLAARAQRAGEGPWAQHANSVEVVDDAIGA